MRNFVCAVLLVAALAVLTAASAGAVDTPRAYFSVSDASGKMVQGAEVKIAGRKDKSCITDKNGYCSIYFETAEEMRGQAAYAAKGGKESELALIANGHTTMLSIE